MKRQDFLFVEMGQPSRGRLLERFEPRSTTFIE